MKSDIVGGWERMNDYDDVAASAIHKDFRGGLHTCCVQRARILAMSCYPPRIKYCLELGAA